MGGAHRPEQKQFLGERIAFLVLQSVLGGKAFDTRKALDGGQRLCPLDICAPAIAGDGGDVDHCSALAKPRRHRLRQCAQPVEVHRQRRHNAGVARKARDIGKCVDALGQLPDDFRDAVGSRDVALHKGGESFSWLADVDADDISAHLPRQFRGACADTGGDAGDQNGLAEKHGLYLSQRDGRIRQPLSFVFQKIRQYQPVADR